MTRSMLRRSIQGFLSVSYFTGGIDAVGRYLDTEHDLRVLVKGVEVLLRVAEAEPLASRVVDRSGDDDPRLDHRLFKATRAEIEEFVRKRMNTSYHPTSTARMAQREDGGVVDEELKVYGVRGLRVVDASVFPT